MIGKIKTFGKFLDQPLLISKLNKGMPAILGGLGAAYFLKTAHDSFEKSTDKDETKKELLNKGIVLASAITGALLAPKIAGKILNRTPIESIEKVKEKNSNLINDFLAKNGADEDSKKILDKAKDKVLNFKEVNSLFNKFEDEKSKAFLEKLIPDPENIKAKDIFQEIGYLSIYGAIPVVSGIIGGVAADKITDPKHAKEKIPDKINEGLYQYLANIFMCNIGAGGALAILEKMNITSKTARAIGMTSGIILTGVLGGSKIANFITKNVISPIMNPKKNKEEIKERKPEPLDLGLHSDDIATVSLLSGLKWIEPALPILYSVSGYKSGVGYRN